MHFGKGRAIIITFQFGTHKTKYGGLAQLVRAPASHAGGLGFESLILHHTVRTRTRFFMRKGSGTFFVYRRFAFATAINTPVGCLSNRIGCQEIPSRMTWNFCFDQGLEWHLRKKSIANEPGAFCRSEASGSLHIHDKSKIPATSPMLQAKNSAGSASTKAGERVKSSGTGSF